MRRSTIYRLLKRALVIFPLLWLLYALSELMHRPSVEEEVQRELAKQIRTLNTGDGKPIDSHSHPVHQQHVDSVNKIRTNNHDNAIEQPKAQTIDHTVQKDIPAVRRISSEGPQMDKLRKLGGILVTKKPSETFADVQLPQFQTGRDASGPGEGGKAVMVNMKELSAEEQTKYNEGWAANSFNQYVSDMMSVHRDLPDCMTTACKEKVWSYSNHLQEISVIIIFHNEAWSVLLRSVHSILARTPASLLREIILVDDYSAKEHLKEPLEKYFNTFKKVQIIRATERQGLTRARLLGYYVSTAPVLVFLDSHIECFPGWAEPLSVTIGQRPTVVAFPSIEVIGDERMEVTCNVNVNQNGGFIFKDLTFNWQFIGPEESARRQSEADPIRSPTMPGGLFAIGREFFETLGLYDPGLDYWGGENIELSFKAWMCGGSVELVTCSHIGHIFRRSNPIRWTKNIGNKNSIRVAEVWMDDYKNYFYERILYSLGDYGDVSARKRLRKDLKCKSFEWYIKNVYPNLVIPSDMKYAGEIRSEASPRCIDSMGGGSSGQNSPKMYPCHAMGYNQFWHMNDQGQIMQDEWHICVVNGEVSSRTYCEPSGPTWEYKENKNLVHIQSGQCLTASVNEDNIIMSPCNADNKWQRWEFQPRRTDLYFPK